MFSQAHVELRSRDAMAFTNTLKIQSLAIGPAVAFRATVPLLKIQRTKDRTVVFTVSGRLDAENVSELQQIASGWRRRRISEQHLDLTDPQS
jgi:hypothetical protein